VFDDAEVRGRLVHAFARFTKLDDDAIAAVRHLPVTQREIAGSNYIVREGQLPQRCALLLEGFIYRQKLTANGQRAIVGLQVPGDFVDLQNLFLDESDHDVMTLTRVIIIDITLTDLRVLASTCPAINRAMWIAGLIEASIFREWLLNVGRRDAHERVAHLLCEISARLEATGQARELSYKLPMTQEQLGDALGLTAVHINRVLKALEKQGLILRQKRHIAIADWQQLRRLADFNTRYLHIVDAAE
jgi:CRP-like cAMP-binding protein